jgi:DNA-3-methyladenine glycosylase
MEKLKREFFERSTLLVAEELIGKFFIFNNKRLIITETEAYVGIGDEACHAARGRTKRTEALYGKPGCLYIYFIYGMYFCMNIVAEKEDVAGGVLLRGMLDVSVEPNKLLDGPGKLCKYLKIDKSYYGLDIVENDNVYLMDYGKKYPVSITPRIGISKAQDKLWRFLAQV